MATEIHVGDIGTIFEAVLEDDGVAASLVTATSLLIRFRRPSGVVVSKAAVFSTDGVDGAIRYVAEAGFLDSSGLWTWQPFVAMPEWTGHGEEVVFIVYGTLAS